MRIIIFRIRLTEIINIFLPDVIVAAVPLTEFFLADLMYTADRIPVVIESHLAKGSLKRVFTERVLDIVWSPERAVCKS